MANLILRVRDFLVKILVAPLEFYQRHISPGLPRRCRYYPTCSEYAVTSLRTHGALKGVALGLWRVLRCNPWSRGGVDHVPAKGDWKAPKWIPPDDWAGHDIEEGSWGILGILRGETRHKPALAAVDEDRAHQELSPEIDEKES